MTARSTSGCSRRVAAASKPGREAVMNDYDAPNVTVRLVRGPDGHTSLAAIYNALPWVLRRPYLLAEDLE